MLVALAILPAIEPPIKVAKPWNSIIIPKAFVSFSSPNKSTSIIDFSVAKQARILDQQVNMILE